MLARQRQALWIVIKSGLSASIVAPRLALHQAGSLGASPLDRTALVQCCFCMCVCVCGVASGRGRVGGNWGVILPCHSYSDITSMDLITGAALVRVYHTQMGNGGTRGEKKVWQCQGLCEYMQENHYFVPIRTCPQFCLVILGLPAEGTLPTCSVGHELRLCRRHTEENPGPYSRRRC